MTASCRFQRGRKLEKVMNQKIQMFQSDYKKNP